MTELQNIREEIKSLYAKNIKGYGYMGDKKKYLSKKFFESNELNNPSPELKQETKTPDVNIEQETIAKGKSKSKGTTIETEMRVKKDLTDNMKKALKKSVIESLENELKGAGLMSDSDSSSSDEESIKPIKRRGRPKKKSI